MIFKKKTEEVVVNEENFQEKWEFVNKKLIQVKRGRITRQMVAALGTGIFLYMMYVITYGALYRIKSPTINAIIGETTFLSGAWKLIEPLVYRPEVHWAVQVLLYLLPTIVVPIIICGSVYGLSLAVYKMKPRELTGDMIQDAKELYCMTKEVLFHKKKITTVVSLGCGFLYIAGDIAYIVWIIVKCFSEEYKDAIMQELAILLQKMQLANIPIIYIQLLSNYAIWTLALLIVLGIYVFLNYIMNKILSVTYKTKFDEIYVEATEKFYYESDPEVKDRIEEENQILARADEIKKQRREERMEFEDSIDANLRKMKKIIKICVNVMSIILMIVAGLWIKSNVDFSSVLEYLNQNIGIEEEVGTEISTEISSEIIME